MIKGCKSTPSPPFLQKLFFFPDQSCEQKILKAFVELNPNNTQINIITWQILA